MTTPHSIIRDEFSNKLSQNKHLGQVAANSFAKFAPEFQVMFTQRRDVKPSVTEKLIACNVMSLIETGKVWVSAFDLGVMPYPDAWVSENQHAVAQAPHPFKVSFSQGTPVPSGECDGTVEWVEPVLGDLGVDGRFLQEPQQSGLPLEVGATEAAKSYQYIQSGMGFARWPYGSSLIWLFVPTIQGRDCKTHGGQSKNVS